MRKYKWLSIAFFVFACSKPLPELTSFDGQTWKEDRNGCSGKRGEMKNALIEERSKLLSLSELQVVELLGRPDQNELYKRNQKFYTYFIDPATNCQRDSIENPKKLIVRFNAMGLAKEITIE